MAATPFPALSGGWGAGDIRSHGGDAGGHGAGVAAGTMSAPWGWQQEHRGRGGTGGWRRDSGGTGGQDRGECPSPVPVSPVPIPECPSPVPSVPPHVSQPCPLSPVPTLSVPALSPGAPAPLPPLDPCSQCSPSRCHPGGGGGGLARGVPPNTPPPQVPAAPTPPSRGAGGGLPGLGAASWSARGDTPPLPTSWVLGMRRQLGVLPFAPPRMPPTSATPPHLPAASRPPSRGGCTPRPNKPWSRSTPPSAAHGGARGGGGGSEGRGWGAGEEEGDVGAMPPVWGWTPTHHTGALGRDRGALGATPRRCPCPPSPDAEANPASSCAPSPAGAEGTRGAAMAPPAPGTRGGPCPQPREPEVPRGCVCRGPGGVCAPQPWQAVGCPAPQQRLKRLQRLGAAGGGSTVSRGGIHIYCPPLPEHTRSRGTAPPRQPRGQMGGSGRWAQRGTSSGVSAPGGAARGVPAAPSSLARRRHSRATTTGLTKATSTTAMSPTFTWGEVSGHGAGGPDTAPARGCAWAGPTAPQTPYDRHGTPIPHGARPPPYHGPWPGAPSLHRAGPPSPMGQDPPSRVSEDPHPSVRQDPYFPMEQDPIPWGAGPPSLHGAGPPSLHGAGTHIEGVPVEGPAHQGDTGVLQQGHQRRQRHGQPIQLPEVLRGEPAGHHRVTAVSPPHPDTLTPRPLPPPHHPLTPLR